MDKLIQDMLSKGLIQIVRKPRSEELAKLVRSTSAVPGYDWHWVDWKKCNQN